MRLDRCVLRVLCALWLVLLLPGPQHVSLPEQWSVVSTRLHALGQAVQLVIIRLPAAPTMCMVSLFSSSGGATMPRKVLERGESSHQLLYCPADTFCLAQVQGSLCTAVQDCCSSPSMVYLGEAGNLAQNCLESTSRQERPTGTPPSASRWHHVFQAMQAGLSVSWQTCQAVAMVGTAPWLMASTYCVASTASMGPVML